MCQDRINNLIQNANHYLNVFVEKNQYRGPSIYFHDKIMNILDETPLIDLQDSITFSECIYSVLVSWGMHKIGTGPQLKNFSDFHKVINNFIQCGIPISNLTITELNEESINQLVTLFGNNSVMHSTRRLVGNSKALHHILPKVIPPIDNTNTLWFFGLKNTVGNESANFKSILKKYQQIITSINWDNINYSGIMNKTRVKIIDNAIIGFRLSQD